MDTDIASGIRTYVETVAPPAGMPDLTRRPAPARPPRRAGVRLLTPRRAVAAVAAAAAVAGVVAGSESLAQSAPPSARAVLVAAVTRTAAQSYRVDSESVWSGFPLINQPTTSSGFIDPARKVAEFTISPASYASNTPPPPGGPPERIIEIGGDTYVYDAPLSPVWTKVPPFPSTLRRGQANWQLDFLPYSSPLSYWRKEGQVREAGPVSGPGWSGTKYAFTYRSACCNGSARITGTVDVDQLGRVRMIFEKDFETNQPQVVTQTWKFSDFGAAVHVTAPVVGSTPGYAAAPSTPPAPARNSPAGSSSPAPAAPSSSRA